MAKTDSKSVDQYIATQPDDVQAILQRVRNAIRKAVPRAVETISYQIPTYKLDGQLVIYFAGWKDHYAIYPATDGVAEEFAEDLVAYKISKGTIRFPLSGRIPVGLIARIAKFRAMRAVERAQAKDSKRRAKAKPRATAKKRKLT